MYFIFLFVYFYNLSIFFINIDSLRFAPLNKRGKYFFFDWSNNENFANKHFSISAKCY